MCADMVFYLIIYMFVVLTHVSHLFVVSFRPLDDDVSFLFIASHFSRNS